MNYVEKTVKITHSFIPMGKLSSFLPIAYDLCVKHVKKRAKSLHVISTCKEKSKKLT